MRFVLVDNRLHSSERTITLVVNNMDCAACPSIVKGSLHHCLEVSDIGPTDAVFL